MTLDEAEATERYFRCATTSGHGPWCCDGTGYATSSRRDEADLTQAMDILSAAGVVPT